jgi:hypothetical protein
LKLAELGNLFREFQGSHQDTFRILEDAWGGKRQLRETLGADLTGVQKIRVTMARAARETNQSRVDTPPNQLPARTTVFPRDNYQSPDTPGCFQFAPIDPISSLSREFGRITLAPTPVAPITSLPSRTLATSIDKIASTRALRDSAITLRGAKAGTFMDLLLTVGVYSFPYLFVIYLLGTQVLDQRAHCRDTRSSKVMKLLQDLSDESDSLPPSLHVNNVTIRDAVKEGVEAQIRSGSYDGLDVAIRQFRQRVNMTEADWRKVIYLPLFSLLEITPNITSPQ